MNNVDSLGDKIKNILTNDFILEKDHINLYISSEREMKFIHKSGKTYITIKIFNRGNLEQDKITDILVYKKVSSNNIPFILSERHPISLIEKEEKALNKLKAMKTKIYLTHIF